MSERKTIQKWFWVWEFEKEEEWLNDMALQGWVLDGIGFCKYHFVHCKPGEYIVRLQLEDADSNYMEFMKEINAEYIGHMAKWIYFRRKADYGIFEITSDLDSRIAHLDRIGKMLSAIGFANIAIGIANSSHSGLGIINLLCACAVMYALGRIHGKKEDLKNERTLHE